MSGFVAPASTSVPGGIIGRLADESASIKAKVDLLNIQASTGLVSTTYGGLGGTAAISLDLRPQIARTQVWSQNIDGATARLSVTSTVMTQLQSIATSFLSGTYNMTAQTSQEVDTMAASAKAALGQVQDLLNTQVGQTYIFAGQDTANAPLPSAAFNAFVASIQAPIATLATAGGPAVAAATLAAATATSPFSTTLGTAPQTVPVGQTQAVPIGIVAGQNAFAASVGTNTTGSYVRDLIRALSTISALNSGQTSLGAPFDSLVADTRTNLQNLGTTISNETSALGVQQQMLVDAKTQVTDTQLALTAQVSGVENVDAATTATALTQAQSQLQISYKLIGDMQNLSLLQFLPVA